MISADARPTTAEAVLAYQPTVTLRDYQDDACHAVIGAVSGQGHRRVLVQLPTGSGKTVIFGALARAALADGLGRVLVLAHRDELIAQAAARLSLWMPPDLIGVVKAETDECDRPLVVGSVQTLRSERRLDRALEAGRFELVVVDEAHHAAAQSYQTILSQLGAFGLTGPIVVGVTATPQRGDRRALDDTFETIAFRRSHQDLVDGGYLVPATSKAFELVPRGTRGRTQLGIDGDYAEGWLGGLLLEAEAPDKIVQAWQAHAAGRPTIVFTPVVSVAKAVAAAFTAAGVKAAWVSGEMPLRERRAALSLLASGDIQVVANCSVLTEGYDEPSVSCIVIGRPTKNESLYIQMVGRGTRTHPGKTDLLILDMVGVTDQLTLEAVAELAGKRDAPSTGTPLAPPAVPEREDVPFEVVEGDLIERRRRPRESVCRWIALEGGWWALSLLSGGWLTLEPDDEGTYRVVHRARYVPPVVHHAGLDLAWAKEDGEGIASNLGVLGPMRRTARWLDRPISDKQLSYGLSVGLAVTPETTSWDMQRMDAARQCQWWKRYER